MKLSVLGYLVQASFILVPSLSANAAPNSGLISLLGPQGVNFWKLDKAKPVAATRLPGILVQDSVKLQDPNGTPEFPVQWFQQPLDHFSKESTHTFNQRYWVNKRHYKPGGGGPVIVIDGGETSGEVHTFNV
jgi:hypothetical protein